MKTYLVTGGAGFIGSHLCRALLARKNRVVCVDSLITGVLANIRDLKKNQDFAFIKHDIIKPLSLKEKINFVFNLACPASPVDYRKFPIKTALTNSLGVKNMLDLAAQKKAVFLHASTSEVYGEPTVHPQKESYWGNVNLVGPRCCYTEGKRFAESLIVNYRRVYGLDARIFRVFNTYGPFMRPDDGRVVSNFIVQALKGESLTIYGDGSQTRAFCFVKDMVEAILKLAESNESGPINLGNPREFTILKLAQKVLKKTGSKSKLVFLPLPKDDPTRRRPDISLAQRKLGWEPKVSLDEGLGRTIEYFRGVIAKKTKVIRAIKW